MKTFKSLLVVLLLAAAAPLAATAQAHDTEVNLTGSDATSASWTFFQSRPHLVLRFIFSCPDATQLKISLANLGTEGLKWQATAYVYGKTTQKKIITSPGKQSVLSAPVILKSGGVTPLWAYVEIRFHGGPATFGSGQSGRIVFESNGTGAFSYVDDYPIFADY
jgi:hypothetical protein